MTVWAEAERLRPGITGSVSTLMNQRLPLYSNETLAGEITIDC